MVALTLKSVMHIAQLLVPLSGLQVAVASPLGGQNCDMVATEFVTSHFITQILLPASTKTSKVFRPGQPPTGVVSPETLSQSTPAVSVSTPFTAISLSVETSGTPCEGASTSTIHVHHMETVHVAQEPVTAETVIYPCASPVPTLISTIPYGDYHDSLGSPGTQMGNTLYYNTSPQGSSAEACCNTCYFELTYCIAAYWYSYEGCVVNQGVVLNGLIGNGVPLTGEGKSTTCPYGTVEGLVYTPNTDAAFRSTGNFAGPCGQSYENLP